MAKSGFGAVFQLSAVAIVGSAGSLAEVTGVGLPNSEVEFQDATHHGSANAQREDIPTLIRIKDLPVKMNMIPGSTTDTTCETAVASRALYYFKITVPAATGTWTYSGQAYVSSYEKDDVVVDGKMEAVVSLKPQGAVTRAAGA